MEHGDDFGRERPKGQTARDLEQEVRRLREKDGWDPSKIVREQPLEALQRLDQELANERVYDRAGACEACDSIREERGDETALCEAHLAEAMGF